jgi:hypothetical protein
VRLNFDDFKEWIQRLPAGRRFAITVWPGNAPLTAAEADTRYSNPGESMPKLKLVIADVLPYHEYGRCKNLHTDPEKPSF